MASDPLEELLRVLVSRELLANSLSAERREQIRELFERIDAIFRTIDPPGPSRSRYRRDRTERALAEISTALREFAPELERALRDDLARIGRNMGERARLGIVASLGTEDPDLFSVDVGVTQSRIRAILSTDPIQGRTLREHTRTWAAGTYNRVRDQIRLGMSAEESTEDIMRRVIGAPAGYRSTVTGRMRKTGGPRAVRIYRGGVYTRAARDAEAIVRTAVTHVSNVGMMETFRANASILEGVEFVATLDDRTTPLCMSLDGTVWPLDSDEIIVPGENTHYGCRSVLAPVISWERLGLEPPPEGTRVARDLRTVSDADLERAVSSRRRTSGFGDVERIPSSVIAEQWLRGQRLAVQKRVLGASRAELFRSGTSLAEMIRSDNTLIPLDELLRN